MRTIMSIVDTYGHLGHIRALRTNYTNGRTDGEQDVSRPVLRGDILIQRDKYGYCEDLWSLWTHLSVGTNHSNGRPDGEYDASRPVLRGHILIQRDNYGHCGHLWTMWTPLVIWDTYGHLGHLWSFGTHLSVGDKCYKRTDGQQTHLTQLWAFGTAFVPVKNMNTHVFEWQLYIHSEQKEIFKLAFRKMLCSTRNQRHIPIRMSR